jgi:hypothetical protein
MAQKISGGCACGAIHYECDVDPVVMMNCHCRDCQKANGAAFAAIMALPRAAFQIRGTPSYHGVAGASGKLVERGFCPSCGSQVTFKAEVLADVIGVQAGTLDDPSIYRPDMDVFTSSAQPWDHMDSSVQKHLHGPPL